MFLKDVGTLFRQSLLYIDEIHRIFVFYQCIHMLNTGTALRCMYLQMRIIWLYQTCLRDLELWVKSKPYHIQKWTMIAFIWFFNVNRFSDITKNKHISFGVSAAHLIDVYIYISKLYHIFTSVNIENSIYSLHIHTRPVNIHIHILVHVATLYL